jgi:hypothetical protein
MGHPENGQRVDLWQLILQPQANGTTRLIQLFTGHPGQATKRAITLPARRASPTFTAGTLWGR